MAWKRFACTIALCTIADAGAAEESVALPTDRQESGTATEQTLPPSKKPTDEFEVKKKTTLREPSSTRSTPSKKKPQKTKVQAAPGAELQNSTQQAMKPPERLSAVDLNNPAFNTDYKTRGVSTSMPDQLRGSGYNGSDIPIGAEDPYRQSLPSDYMPTDLVRIPPEWCYYEMPLYLRKEAADSLLRMFRDAAAQGLRLYIFSGYRDYRHQQRLYAEAVRRRGPNQKTVAKPGRSEHALGTTADVTNGSQYLMKRSFVDTPEGRWLKENAGRYGWKMTVIPGEGRRSHADEPWHIRYLGGGTAPAQSIAQHQSLPGQVLRTPGKLLNTFKKSLAKLTNSLPLKRHLSAAGEEEEVPR